MKIRKLAIVSWLSAILAAAAVPASAAVSAVSSNAISLDAGDWSKVFVASMNALPSFSSVKPGAIIILR